MEAGESGTRQSAFTSASKPDTYGPRFSEPPGRHNREVPAMAAAALINPATAYHPHTQPFSSPFHQPAPPPPMPGMISPGESRRASNETEPAQRQSLPSISEVFSTKPSPYSPTTPTTLGGSQGLPPPFNSAPPSRAEPAPEPRSMPPHEEKYYRYPPRSEVGPSQGPPNAYPFPEQRNPTKISESAPAGNHVNPPPPPQIPYPPGQLPLSAAPISPRHAGPSIPPYDSNRPPLHAEDEYGMHRNRYDTTLNRHFEAWGYQECLSKIAWVSRTIFNFAEAYGKIASEQHGGQPIPERLPSEREVSEMLSNVQYMKQSLENVRDIVQHSIATEKAREGGRAKGPYDGDDDMSMYGDGMKQPYSIGEVKKRRGRAAPPGRCHSCNRIDTPEWRRGPDGARTLCNACGLHYAKLERKRQMEQRSIRPKAVEERV
ncbi:hypothetical protein F4775DRAFT_589552 [Biscogniauxia sp. FL1348]|nr:hypothetical protein F4775DRAFT_589552 [Biscogniauxia sp. FL1348]